MTRRTLWSSAAPQSRNVFSTCRAVSLLESIRQNHSRRTVRMSRGTYQGSDGTHDGSPGGSIRLVRRFVMTHGKRNGSPAAHCVVEADVARRPGRVFGRRNTARCGEQCKAHPHRSPLHSYFHSLSGEQVIMQVWISTQFGVVSKRLPTTDESVGFIVGMITPL
jgi:hypothetical protein